MQAYKLKGTIDPSGQLVIHNPIAIPPGDVEVIVWPSETIEPDIPPKRVVACDIPALKEWLEKTEPVPPDFDADRAKWEYLKEKHNL
jgi:hypothetical protein